MKESKAIKKFAIGAVVRAGIAGAKYLSKKASESAAKKASESAAKKAAEKAAEKAAKKADTRFKSSHPLDDPFVKAGAVTSAAALGAARLDTLKRDRERAEAPAPAPAPAPARTEFENLRRGGSVSSASKRADGCATKGKTKGRFV